jgi:hypothetical protein
MQNYKWHYIFNRIRESLRLNVIGKISTWWFILYYQMKGGKLGKNLIVYGHVILRNTSGKIFIGNNVTIISSSWRSTASALNHPTKLCTLSHDAEIVIEDGCSLNGTSITCRSSIISLCKDVMIAPNVTIVDSDFHNIWPPEARLEFDGVQNDAPVKICRNVWIGMNTLILKGVTIGENSVVAAGSVVVNNIPPNCMAAGNPAEVKRHFIELQ